MPEPVAVLVGTRPEAVKVAPVVLALRALGQPTIIVDTGQQPGRVGEALLPFGLAADHSLDIQRLDGHLSELIALVVRSVDDWLTATPPAALLVQGDTTTAFAGGLAAAMRAIPVIHLEAGLRTGDRSLPFPEEINRTLLADLASLHLAPTPRAAAALAVEGHQGDHVIVTGNTVVDALETILPAARQLPLPNGVIREPGHALMTVTVHRREAWGDGVRAVSWAVRDLLDAHPDLQAVVVAHPNPAVAADVRAVLGGVERCDVVEPLPYDEMLSLLAQSSVVLTDSGGIQEEAPSLGLPAVVARSVTERAEGVAAGWADLVGLDRAEMVAAVSARLGSNSATPTGNPYGDGQAAGRCAEAIRWFLGTGEKPKNWSGN